VRSPQNLAWNPVVAIWEVTRACDLRCVHCRASANPDRDPRELSTAEAFDLIEQATTLIDQNDIGFSFPIPNVVMKHYAGGGPIPEWWGKVKGLYLEAMDEMYRVNTRAREGNREFSLYIARRCELAAEYLSSIESVRKAGIAREKGDREMQLAELEKAVESMYNALDALSAVARSNSDRGVIAVLNEYGYRPLKRELETK